jgi:hypothetical protein
MKNEIWDICISFSGEIIVLVMQGKIFTFPCYTASYNCGMHSADIPSSLICAHRVLSWDANDEIIFISTIYLADIHIYSKNCEAMGVVSLNGLLTTQPERTLCLCSMFAINQAQSQGNQKLVLLLRDSLFLSVECGSQSVNREKFSVDNLRIEMHFPVLQNRDIEHACFDRESSTLIIVSADSTQNMALRAKGSSLEARLDIFRLSNNDGSVLLQRVEIGYEISRGWSPLRRREQQQQRDSSRSLAPSTLPNLCRGLMDRVTTKFHDILGESVIFSSIIQTSLSRNGR